VPGGVSAADNELGWQERWRGWPPRSRPLAEPASGSDAYCVRHVTLDG